MLRAIRIAGVMNMQTVINTGGPAMTLLGEIHAKETLSGAWRQIAGVDLRSWLLGNRMVIGADDGPNSAVVVASGAALSIEHENDAEGWFIRAAIEAMARRGQ
jgi:hypothetical protein